MMSLEEFYSAIADAYSVAKGDRPHYTKEEIAEKLNRQLKSGRIVGEATTQVSSNGDMSWIRSPSNRGFGVGMSADEVLESVDNKPAEENLDWRKGIREYEAATKNIVKGVGISLLLTVILLIIFSLILTYTTISENTINPVIMIITALSILIGSSLSNTKIKKNGLMNGGIIGGIYILLLYIVSSLLNWKFSLNIQSILMIVIGIVFGILGGIIGVNKK